MASSGVFIVIEIRTVVVLKVDPLLVSRSNFNICFLIDLYIIETQDFLPSPLKDIFTYTDISLMNHLLSTFENENQFKALLSIYLLLTHLLQ